MPAATPGSADTNPIEEFASAVSHDLNSSLGIIGGYAGLLDRRNQQNPDAKTAEFVASIRRQVKVMDKLLEGWRQFFVLATRPLKPTDIDMGALVSKTWQDLKPAVAQIRIQNNSLLPAHADMRAMTELWRQLLSNAVLHGCSAAGATVHISSQASKGGTLYCVEDEGPGFSEADAVEVFKPLHRLNVTDHSGAGLGLAIARQVVQMHGGRLWATSRTGGGAALHFWLPVSTSNVAHDNEKIDQGS